VRKLLKAGDWLPCCWVRHRAWLFATLWHTDRADKAVVRSGGKIVAEFPLAENRTFRVQGPLGESLIAIHDHRARVAQDPSPRQYCVKQGWLARQGEMAVCRSRSACWNWRGQLAATH
jgi:hypothetical protein